MRLQSQIFALLAMLPAVSVAETQQAHFLVSAEVLPRASIQAVGAPSQVQVTAADLSRGYVDVDASYRVQTNDPRGYWLRFATRSGLADSVEVRGLAAPVTVGDLGAEVLQKASGRVQAHALQFHLHLAPTAQPGMYELPVLVAVSPL
jgi:hypothetical protein